MKIDLHVHSQYSIRPSLWVLQKLSCHECYTSPLELYKLARERGMDWVTITDHNTINGCLEIAHLPQTFISEEVTSYFPEDGCKVHVLVYHINQEQHREIQKLRENLFALVAYLQQEAIPHALAHPLWSVNGRLTVLHFEKLLLLFKNFEINGSRDDQLNLFLRRILDQLTPACYDQLIDKHGIVPGFPEPWRKNLIGGSDDHSSLTIARIHTEVAGATSLAEFFAGLENHQARVNGQASDPVTLAHNIYSIAYQFYAHKMGLRDQAKFDDFLNFLENALLPTAVPKCSRLLQVGYSLFRKKTTSNGKSEQQGFSLLDLVKEEISRFIQEDPQLKTFFAAFRNHGPVREEEWCEFITRLANQLLRKFSDRLLTGINGAHLVDVLQSLTAIGVVYLLLTPYFAAYNSFAQDRHFSQKILAHFAGAAGVEAHRPAIKLAHFTDTFYEINGVALTLRQQVQEASCSNKPYVVITCDPGNHADNKCVKNFIPLAVWDLPEYQEQKLFHPPILEILRYCYEEGVNHILAATPGPMGLTALFIARLLDLPIDGTYHTSLPQYAKYLTEDMAVEDLMWRYILWFYNQMQTVYAPSSSTATELTERGLEATKIRIFPRGVDVQRFQPSKRNGILRDRYQIDADLKLLYVGRISKEKNLQLLAQAFMAISAVRPQVHLVVVGEGPYLEEMREVLAGYPCTFTGYLEGEDLAAVYAACDIFVFPSTTDTFGNVVLEAQASGLPVIVSSSGGPRENMIPGETGLVVQADDAAELVQATLTLIDEPARRRQMGRAARTYIENRSFSQAFHATWKLYEGLGCPA